MVGKKVLYEMVKKCVPDYISVPEMKEIEFRQYRRTQWMDFCVEQKMCKIVYEELSAGEPSLWIRVVDFFEDKTIYDRVMHPGRLGA